MTLFSPPTSRSPGARDPSGGPSIDVRGLVKRYGDFTAVDQVDLAVQPGEIFGILGPNGAGKTTTLEIIEGLRQPDAGAITVAGIDASRDPASVKRVIGVQLQTTALFDYLTARELLGLFAALYGRRLDRAALDALLRLVSLEEKAGAYVETLSGGQQQRLSIALALVNDPTIIFLDEPTTGLDPQARRNLWDVIRQIREGGKTVVLTTHYMEEAEVLCDRVAIMDHGRIIACDTPRGLIDGLGGLTTVRASLNGGHLPLADLRAIPGVTSAELADGYVELQTADAPATVSRLLRLADERRVRLQQLTTTSANLEDVFLSLTGRSLRE